MFCVCSTEGDNKDVCLCAANKMLPLPKHFLQDQEIDSSRKGRGMFWVVFLAPSAFSTCTSTTSTFSASTTNNNPTYTTPSPSTLTSTTTSNSNTPIYIQPKKKLAVWVGGLELVARPSFYAVKLLQF